MPWSDIIIYKGRSNQFTELHTYDICRSNKL